jgi:hypothetical protein
MYSILIILRWSEMVQIKLIIEVVLPIISMQRIIEGLE